MSSWTGLDFFLFLVLFVNTILGLSRGATKEIISLMCVSVGLIFTIRFSLPIMRFTESSPLVGSVVSSVYVQNFFHMLGGTITYYSLKQSAWAISIVVCFMGAYGIAEAILSFTGLAEVFPFPYLAWNRKVGKTLGCVRGYVFCVIIVLVGALHLGIPTGDSYFVKALTAPAQALDVLIVNQDVEHYRDIYKGKDFEKTKDAVLKNVT